MEYNGLHFSKGTKILVAEALYNSYKLEQVTHIHYGDTATGKDNVDLYGVTGKVVKRTGSQSTLQLETDLGVLDISSHQIVKLVTNGVVTYKHPLYHLPTIDVIPLIGGKMTLSVEGRNIATSVSSLHAKQIIDYLNNNDSLLEHIV